MSTAFIVLAHDDPPMLNRLLAALDGHSTFIHIDKMAAKAGMVEEITPLDHIRISSQHICVHWGGFSVVRAMMETMDWTLRHLDPGVTHIAFLSGHCYPLRPVSEFADFLASSHRPVHCRAFDLAARSERQMSLRRVTHRYWLDRPMGHAAQRLPAPVAINIRRVLTSLTSRPRMHAPDVTHACGSQWVALPLDLADEIATVYALGGFGYLRNALSPDEIAIPTYVYNTHWATMTQKGSLDDSSGRTPSAYENFHWLRSYTQRDVKFRLLRPPTLRHEIDDISLIDEALGSGQYFIRKVGSRNPAIIQAIEERWTHPTGGPSVGPRRA